MNCIVCGAINPDGSESCSICGAKLGVASQDGVVTNDVTGMDTATGANNMTGTTGAQDVAGASATDVNNINGMNGAYDVTGMNSVAGAIGANNAAAAGQTGMDGGRNLGTLKGSHDVFISYSTKNKNIADAVVANFEQNGIRCWYAPRDILPGQEWVSAIKEGLHTAKVFVLIYTEESNQSRQVMNEVALAFNASKTIVPFRLTEDGMNDELEYYLTRVHWLDALSKPMSKNIDKLREYVQVILNGNTGVPASNSQTGAKDAASEKKASGAKASKKNGKKKIAIISAVACVLIAAVVVGILAFGKGKGKNKEKEDYMALGLEAYNSDLHGTEDDAKAVEYFTKAAETDPDAYYYLGKLKVRVMDNEGAVEEFNKGVDSGSNLAKVGLANLYIEGEGVDTDLGKARELLEDALSNGCIEANLWLGYMAARGLSDKLEEIDPNAEKALQYFEEAAKSEDVDIVAHSYVYIGDLYRIGLSGIEGDTQKALDYYDKAERISTYYKGLASYYEGYTYKVIDDTINAEKAFEDARECLERSKDAGCIVAYRFLGVIYRYGYGVPESGVTAISYFQQAADKGDNSSMYNLGQMYKGGSSDLTRNYDKAYEWFSKAAALDNSNAMAAIGDLYYEGYYGTLDDGSRDYEKAKYYYEKAEAKGNGYACSQLVEMYRLGYIQDTDNDKMTMVKAKLEKAAMYGNADSIRWLGYYYYEGRFEGDEEENKKTGIKWLEIAMAMGNSDAMNDIGLIYIKGTDMAEGLPEEERYNKAEELWKMAVSEDNNKYALYNLGRLYKKIESEVDNPDYGKSFEYFLKAAEAGHVNSMFEVGCRYWDGKTGQKNEDGTAKADYEEAVKWFEQAEENGDAKAIYRLALAYCQGKGVEKNYDIAVEKTRAAIKANGDENLADLLVKIGQVYYYGIEEQTIDYAKAFELFEEAATYGEADALAYLGTCYLLGRGVDKEDYDKAYELLKQAEEKGSTDAVLYGSLAQYYYFAEGENEDWSKSAEYWEKVLEAKNNGANCDLDDYEYGLLAWVYTLGEDHGVTPDYKKAEKYALMGVENDENNDNNSYYVLFRLYTDDKITDIEKDYHKGCMYMIKRLNNHIQSGNTDRSEGTKNELVAFAQKDPSNVELIKKIVEELKSSGEISDKTANEVLEAIK